MALSIAPATWSCVHILMQVFKMRAKDAAELELIFTFLKMTPSIKYWITAPPTPPMVFSIALTAWSYVHILTQGSTIRARDAAYLELTFSFLKTTPCPDGTDPC